MVWRLHSLHLSRGLQKRNLYLVLAGDLGYSISKLLTVASSDNINTLRKREKKRNDHNKLKYLIIWLWSWDFFCVIVDEGKASLGLSLCSQYIICSKSQWVCRYAHNISYAKSYTHFDWFLFAIYWGTDVYSHVNDVPSDKYLQLCYIKQAL